MSLAHNALAHGTLPALVFDAPLGTDEPDTLDLRALDVPVSDAEIRNDLRTRWREQPRLVVRIDDEPTARVEALLLELVRREVRLTASDVDRFSDAHTVVVKVSSKAPSPRLARLFPVRLRASLFPPPDPRGEVPAKRAVGGLKAPVKKTIASPGRTDARRR
jgi:hypothetical protein